MEFNSAVYVPSDTNVDDFARTLSDEIIDKYEKALLEKMVDSEFSYLSGEDRNKIIDIAMRIACPDSEDILSAVHYNRRRALIEEAVKKYLSENDSIIVDGFIKFRLGDYKDELRRIYHAAVDEFAAEREYEEFLEMLRFFVSVQSPREDIVHIVKKDGELRILNKRKKDITDIYASEFAPEEDLTSEDIALSALIAIAPQMIVIHDDSSADALYKTIEAIFSDVVYR